MAETSIEWTAGDDGTPGKVWNPTTGCDRISAGCDRCYALTLAKRLKGMGQPKYQNDGDPRTSGPGFGLTVHEDALTTPFTWKKPTRVFVNSMSDLLHAKVPLEFVQRVFDVIERTPQHTYIVLTKRASRLPRVADQLPWPRNLWMGVSVEDADNVGRIDDLRAVPAAVRLVSAEPLVGALGDVDLTGISWLIAGGESGAGARPMHPNWVRSLRDQCQAAGVAFFLKQWGQYGVVPKKRPDGLYDMSNPGVTVANDGTVYQPGDLAYPDGPRWGEALRAGHDKASLTAMYRVGKKESGRELDGREWSEFPRQPGQVTA